VINTFWNINSGLEYRPVLQQLASNLPFWMRPSENVLSFTGNYPGINMPDIIFKSKGAL
jgi:hypothetical protein